MLSFDGTATHIVVADEHAGGMLAAGKMEKRLAKKKINGPKYVRAQWILDSIKNGKRMAEGNYQPAGGPLRQAGQTSVMGMFGRK